MATERAYVQEHFGKTFRVMLQPEVVLWGGMKKFAADLIVDTLNVAFDKVEEEARRDERDLIVNRLLGCMTGLREDRGDEQAIATLGVAISLVQVGDKTGASDDRDGE